MTMLAKPHTPPLGHVSFPSLIVALITLASPALADMTPGRTSPEDDQLPLPRWTDSEIQSFRESALFPGDGLLPGMGHTIPDFTGLQQPDAGPLLQDRFTRPVELPSRLKPEEMRLFLPEALLGRTASDSPVHRTEPTPVSVLQKITPEFIRLCEQTRRGDFLIDPELHLPEMQAQTMLEFLKFHANDARVQIYVLVLPKDRKWPDDLPFDHIASGSLLARESCLVVYPLSEPWRAQMFLSRSIHTHASDTFLQETLQACVSSALQTTDAHDQLHRYVVELSTRLFWLQNALAGRTATTSSGDMHLASVAPGKETSGGMASTLPAFLTAGGAVALMAAVILIAWLGARRRLRTRQTKFVWYFQEPETIPRLGGAFTGGGGGVLRY